MARLVTTYSVMSRQVVACELRWVGDDMSGHVILWVTLCQVMASSDMSSDVYLFSYNRNRQIQAIIIFHLEIVIFHISIATFHISGEVRWGGVVWDPL